MKNIRDILAANLKEYRRIQGLTQEQFAEKAGVSTHYIAVVETCKTFPTAEMLERLAGAFGIESHQLFSVPVSPNEAFEHLLQQGITDIKQVIRETINETYSADCKASPDRS